MISKFLEKKVELNSIDYTVEFGSPIELEYYIIESFTEDMHELVGKKVYGVEIVKKECSGNYVNIESELVKNLSCCRESARQVLDKLADNTVTPMAMPFIIDDMLGIQI